MTRTTTWTARRVGKRYCSTACGRGCTFAEFQKASKAAERLVKRLGDGWKPRVWENLGWHYEVTNEAIRLSEYWTKSGGRKVREYAASAFNSSDYRVERNTPEAALETLELMLRNGASALIYAANRIKQARA